MGQLLATKYPHALLMWECLEKMIQKIDFMKYFILLEYGGCYIDMDIEPILPIDPLVERHSIVFSKTTFSKLESFWAAKFNLTNIAQLHFNNAFIACAPNHPVMQRLVELLPTHIKMKHMVYQVQQAITVGPEVLCKAFNETKEMGFSFLILPYEVVESKKLNKSSFAIHHTLETWTDGPKRQELVNIFWIAIFFVVVSIVLAIVIIKKMRRKN